MIEISVHPEPFQPGIIWASKKPTAPFMRVKIVKTWPSALHGAGCLYAIWDPSVPAFSKAWEVMKTIDQPVFEELYKYDPAFNPEYESRLATAVLRNARQNVAYLLDDCGADGDKIVDLLVRAVRQEAAARIRNHDWPGVHGHECDDETPDDVANLIEERLTEAEMKELMGL